MSKLSLIKKIVNWYGFRFEISELFHTIYICEVGTNNSYRFLTIEDALKAFYDIMLTTNNNLKACHYQIWSDEELSFIASL